MDREAQQSTRISRFLRFPLTWLVIGAVAIIFAVQLTTAMFGETGIMGTFVAPLVGTVAAIALYGLTMRWIAMRATPELAHHSFFIDGLLGIAFGTVFILLSVGTLSAIGTYTVTWTGINLWGVLGPILAMNIGVAAFEELLFRGLLFQAVQQLFGNWVALTATSLAFGILHFFNPGTTIWTAIAIVLEAGLLLGAAFM